MSITLKIIRTGSAPEEIHLPWGSFDIGRDRGHVVLHDPQASSSHARMTARPDGVFVEDVGSTNGTFISGRPVVGVARLQLDEVLRVGDSSLVLTAFFAPAGGTLVAGDSLIAGGRPVASTPVPAPAVAAAAPGPVSNPQTGAATPGDGIVTRARTTKPALACMLLVLAGILTLSGLATNWLVWIENNVRTKEAIHGRLLETRIVHGKQYVGIGLVGLTVCRANDTCIEPPEQGIDMIRGGLGIGGPVASVATGTASLTSAALVVIAWLAAALAAMRRRLPAILVALPAVFQLCVLGGVIAVYFARVNEALKGDPFELWPGPSAVALAIGALVVLIVQLGMLRRARS